MKILYVKLFDWVVSYTAFVTFFTFFLEIPFVVFYASFLDSYEKETPFYALAVTFAIINFIWQTIVLVSAFFPACRLINCCNCELFDFDGIKGIITP